MRNKLQLYKSNKGAGLPSVIIAIAFIAILGSILLTITFTNYNMKQTNYKTKDSFYSAEQALDEINIGLQNVISKGVSDAYLEVLENYATYDIDKKKDLMESVYFSSIWGDLEIIGSNHKQFDLNKLRGYLNKTAWSGDLDTGYGAIITSENNNVMETYTDSGVVLKDIKIYYRDARGFVSVIHTDIRLALPDLEFSMDTVLPNIADYTLIADEKLVTGSIGTNQISGEIYVGNLEAFGSNPLIRSKFNIINNTSFVVKNDIHLKNIDFLASDTSEIWGRDLIVESSSAIINGVINLSDDTNLLGNNSEVIIKNIYNGYGNSLSDSSESSAILVNGTNAVLDVEDCNIVTIAGHAYIGTKKENNGAPGSGGNVGRNVLMGESVSVKSNQLLYLVPSECMGILKVTGKSVYNKNPMTANEYQEIISKPSTYTEVDDTIFSSKLGSALSKYIKYNPLTSLPEVEKVFVTTNAETLVYYYMKFNSENSANEYFQNYYAINSDQMLEYMDFYTNGISIERPELMLRMQLAGNMLKYDEASSKASLQTNTLTNASEKLESASVQYGRMKDALCTKLVSSYAELTNVYTTDLSDDIVFDNIVDETALTTFITNYATGVFGSSKGYIFSDLLNGQRALLIDNPGDPYIFYAPAGSTMSNVHLIIATGDVQVNSNFSGLILSNGIVTLSNNVNVNANNGYVKESLRLSATEGGTYYSVIGFLRDGTDLLTLDGSEEEHDSVKLANLVVYENWKKE